MQVPGPRVLAAEAPVPRERHGGDDEFPADALRSGVLEPGEEGGELGGAEHGFFGGGGRGFGRAVAARVEEEEGGGAVGEGGVCCVRVWNSGGRIDGSVVEVEGVEGSGVGGAGAAVPIVGDFVVVEDMEPGEGRGGRRPGGRGVDLAVFAAIGFGVGTEAAGDVDVDEVAEEEHEGGVELGEPGGEVGEAGDGEGVLERGVGELGFDAAGGEEGKFVGVGVGLAGWGGGGEGSGVVIGDGVLVGRGGLEVCDG